MRPRHRATQRAGGRSASQRPAEPRELRDGPLGRPQTRLQLPAIYSPTHYAPFRAVPGPQFGDPKGQEGSDALAVIAQAGPPAVDCGTAPPCGGPPVWRPGGTLDLRLVTHLEGVNGVRAEEMQQRQSDSEIERLLSPEEVARACGLSRRAVYRSIARGELRATRLCNRLRIRPAEFEKWIAAGTPGPETAARPAERTTPKAGTARGLRTLLAEEGRASL
jgi:excisionase family DNA binding protein